MMKSASEPARVLGTLLVVRTAYSGEGERDSGRKPNGIPVGR
jgi:hypothetical protein